MNSLPTPTEEQQEIVDLYQQGKNLSVITPAGGGKTTIALMCVSQDSSKKETLWLTYNKNLKEEIRIKAKNLNLKHVKPHNFHSFAVKYINKEAYGDDFYKIVEQYNGKLDPKYDVLIIDEAQDINPAFYKLILKIITDCSVKQIFLIGDPRQCINKHNNSSPKYLLDPNQFFSTLGKIIQK